MTATRPADDGVLADAKSPTLDRQVETAIVRDIVSWRLPPGAWIRERQYAERFGCSHGPVREALRNLSREGFVVVVPWRGARVAELDEHSIEDVFELWKCLFGTVCGMAARNMPADEAQRLLRMQADYEATCRTASTTQEQIRVSWPMGILIARHCGSPLAEETLGRIARIARWQHKLLDHDEVEKLQPELGLHWSSLYRRTIEAIVARDAARAESAAREFLGHTQSQIGRALQARAVLNSAQR